MTAGIGIIHQEMPSDRGTELWGLQLWVNLPAANKMMEPRYRDISDLHIPEYISSDGSRVKVIVGTTHKDVVSPACDIICRLEYLDVALPSGGRFEHDTETGSTVIAYGLQGQGRFSPAEDRWTGEENLIQYDEGTMIIVRAGKEPLRFVLISGRPLGEPAT